MRRLALIAGLLSAAAATPGPAAEAPGAKAFARHCAACHDAGAEAVGTLQLARTRGKDKALLAGRKDLPAEYVRVIVRNGLKAMPSFGPAEVPEAELAAIAAYVTR